MNGIGEAGLPPLDADALARLDVYAGNFREVFRRRDQLDRFRAYLRGLLDGDPAKAVEAIAARLAGASSASAQALQHFITSSPWHADGLLGAYRSALGDRLHDAGAVWVVLDLAFPKKGRHSVGVQRQLARPVGRKVNCQVAVAVAQVGPAGFFPLEVRLYLPGRWLEEPARVEQAGVPDAHREVRPKADIALGLLDRLRAELPSPAGIAGDDGYWGTPAFAEGLAARGLAPIQDKAPLARCLASFAWMQRHLGLDRFEGRTWHGWHHHAALVLTAYGFLLTSKTMVSSPR